MHPTVLPWIAGLIGVCIGIPIVGGNSLWLLAFAGIPWALVMVAIWP